MRILPLLGVNYFFYYVDKVCEQLLIQRESRFVDRSAEFAFFSRLPYPTRLSSGSKTISNLWELSTIGLVRYSTLSVPTR